MLISVDTLRADHIGCYGYERDTTPVIDQLAGEGVQFGVTYSQDSRTLGSVSSLLTSLYTITHGVGQYGRRIASEVTTLAEVFQGGGYQTASFITNIHAGTVTDQTSNTYWDWMLDHAFMLVPAQAIVGEFLATFQEFPPRQKAASFSLDQVMEKLQTSSGSH